MNLELTCLLKESWLLRPLLNLNSSRIYLKRESVVPLSKGLKLSTLVISQFLPPLQLKFVSTALSWETKRQRWPWLWFDKILCIQCLPLSINLLLGSFKPLFSLLFILFGIFLLSCFKILLILLELSFLIFELLNFSWKLLFLILYLFTSDLVFLSFNFSIREICLAV